MTEADCAPTPRAVADRTVDPDQKTIVRMAAKDPGGQALTDSVAGAPAGSTFDATRGILPWRPAAGDARRGASSATRTRAARTLPPARGERI